MQASQSQPSFAWKGADTSSQQRIESEQWTWLVCSVKVMPVN